MCVVYWFGLSITDWTFLLYFEVRPKKTTLHYKWSLEAINFQAKKNA